MIEPHTPLPWKADNLELQDMLSATSCVYAEGYPLVSLNVGHGSHENAQYMAMACNEYPKLKEQNKEFIEALGKANEALNLWVLTYASEFCDCDDVIKAHQILMDGGGTLGYISNLMQNINNLIEGDKEQSND